MKWLVNLFVRKAPKKILELKIKKVTFTFGLLGCEYHENVFDQLIKDANSKTIVPVKYGAGGVSISSIVTAEKPDLNIELHFNSYAQKEECEVLYLADDKRSKELAEHFALRYESYFKRKAHVQAIHRTDKGYATISQFKLIKYKILVKPFNFGTLEEGIHSKSYADFLNKWVDKL